MQRLRIPCLGAAAATAAATLFGAAGSASAEFASSVQSFSQGTVGFADGVSTYNNASTAVGAPNRIAGASFGFPGPVTPFNPPFEQTEIVSVGLGGQITLELPSAVPVIDGTLQVGIFHSAGLNDPAFTGQAENPARTFAGREFGADRTAVVEVADALGNFQSLGRVLFTQPTQGFANQSDPYMFPSPSPIPSDFTAPFAGSLSSFDGMSQPQVTAMLSGSGGGTWLSLTPAAAAALDEIRFVRISDPMWQVHGSGALEPMRTSAFDPDGGGPQQPFVKPADLFVDAISVVPEPAGLAVVALVAMCATCRRRV